MGRSGYIAYHQLPMPIGIVAAHRKNTTVPSFDDPSPDADGVQPVHQTDPEEGVAQQGDEDGGDFHEAYRASSFVLILAPPAAAS